MRHCLLGMLLPAVLLLSARASHRAAPAPAPAVARIVLTPQPRDGQGALRFHMTQSGRQMTADQFDAWMKANGVRVATGRPAPAPAPGPTER